MESNDWNQGQFQRKKLLWWFQCLPQENEYLLLRQLSIVNNGWQFWISGEQVIKLKQEVIICHNIHFGEHNNNLLVIRQGEYALHNLELREHHWRSKKSEYFSNVFDWINVHTSNMFSHLFNEEIVFTKSFSKICLIKTSQISLKSSWSREHSVAKKLSNNANNFCSSV